MAAWEGAYIQVLRVIGTDYCESPKWQKTAPIGARTKVFRAFSQPEDGHFRLEVRKMRQNIPTLKKGGGVRVFW